jgi:hypothetical protein
MDIGKAVPAWLNDWAAEVAQAWELMGRVGWEIEYEYIGAMQHRPRDDGPEDLWRVTMFPMPVEEDEEGQLLPETRVDVLAVQEMLDEVEDVSLSSNGTVSVTGVKNKTMVEVNVRCFPPEEQQDAE